MIQGAKVYIERIEIPMSPSIMLRSHRYIIIDTLGNKHQSLLRTGNGTTREALLWFRKTRGIY